MLPPEVTAAVEQIIKAVSAGEYAVALASTDASRCSASDIARVVMEYGRHFSAPPFTEWDAILISTNPGVERWSIRAPLWCDEEGGRSDLELYLTASSSVETASIEFDDIRVA